MEELFAEMDRITEKFYNEIDRLTEKLQPKQRPYIRDIVSEVTNASEDQKRTLIMRLRHPRSMSWISKSHITAE